MYHSHPLSVCHLSSWFPVSVAQNMHTLATAPLLAQLCVPEILLQEALSANHHEGEK